MNTNSHTRNNNDLKDPRRPSKDLLAELSHSFQKLIFIKISISVKIMKTHIFQKK